MATNEILLGNIITKPATRDAVHIAIAPVIASEDLKPGQHIGLVEGTNKATSNTRKCIGIVDPFLKKQGVKAGQEFFMCLYPNTVTSMKHFWEHPSFQSEQKIDTKDKNFNKIVDARSHILEIALELGVDNNELLDRAREYIDYGNYWSEGDRFEGMYLPSEFWDYFEILTGKRVSDSDRNSFFSCSC